jgi:hypothetical protein
MGGEPTGAQPTVQEPQILQEQLGSPCHTGSSHGGAVLGTELGRLEAPSAPLLPQPLWGI